MLSYSQLEKGVRIIMNNDPYEIIKAAPMFRGRGQSVLNTEIRNLKTGNVTSKTFHGSDSFEEADIDRMAAKFIYSNKGEYFFCEEEDSSKRFSLKENQIANKKNFLKPDQKVEALLFQGTVINVFLPVKVNLKVKMAPPTLKGESSSGNKMAILETGININVPGFIKTGDILEINTETGEYSRRIE